MCRGIIRALYIEITCLCLVRNGCSNDECSDSTLGGRSHADRRGGVRTGIPQVVYNQLYLYSFETNEWRRLPTEGGVIGRKSHSCVIYEDGKSRRY